VATVQDFLDRLPQFEGVPEATIQIYLDEAGQTVTTDWEPQADLAQIMLAAHNMSIAGIGPERGAAALAGVSSIRSASLSITTDKSSMGNFALTSFGIAYYPIMVGISSGPRVTGTGELPYPYGCYRPWGGPYDPY
jgi:hypothetical protein